MWVAAPLPHSATACKKEREVKREADCGTLGEREREGDCGNLGEREREADCGTLGERLASLVSSVAALLV